MFVNFRLCNNHLPNVERNDRICCVCNSGEIGDEFHYLFKCPHFSKLKNQLLPADRLRNANCISSSLLMNENEEQTFEQLCKFIANILKYFKNPPGRPNNNL